MFQGFRNFILRGNVVDLAVGVVVGGAFGTVVDSLVKGVITPLIGVLGGKPDFSSLSFTLNGNTFLYGDFLSSLLSFLIVAGVVYFFIVTPMGKLMAKFNPPVKEAPKTKQCPECLSDIPAKASRCMYCTAVLKK